jgi:hypothetical protein
MMKKFLKWLGWNALLSGPLAVGYFTDHRELAGAVIGGVYIVFIAVYLIALISVFTINRASKYFSVSADILDKLREATTIRWWNYLEPIYPIFALMMGYQKIGVAMLIEIVLYVGIYRELNSSE